MWHDMEKYTQIIYYWSLNSQIYFDLFMWNVSAGHELGLKVVLITLTYEYVSNLLFY